MFSVSFVLRSCALLKRTTFTFFVISFTAGEVNKGKSSIPPGLSVPPGLALPPEQLTATGYVHVAFPSPGHQPLPSVPWHSGMSPLVMTGLCGTLPAEVQGAGEVSAYLSSPHVSRQSSPSQSGSPSRAGSPARMQPPLPPSAMTQPAVPGPDWSQNFSKILCYNRRGDTNGSLSSAAALRQNCVDTSVITQPSQQQHKNISRKSSMEIQDSFRETLVKELPSYQNLQNYKIDQVGCMS